MEVITLMQSTFHAEIQAAHGVDRPIGAQIRSLLRAAGAYSGFFVVDMVGQFSLIAAVALTINQMLGTAIVARNQDVGFCFDDFPTFTYQIVVVVVKIFCG